MARLRVEVDLDNDVLLGVVIKNDRGDELLRYDPFSKEWTELADDNPSGGYSLLQRLLQATAPSERDAFHKVWKGAVSPVVTSAFCTFFD